MPCTVDTSVPDEKIRKLFEAHHRKVERILENLIDGYISAAEAQAEYKQAKWDLKDSQDKIWENF